MSLQAVIESPRRLDELSCARILGSVADAVHAAHKSGHSLAALTPAAIVVRPDGGIAFAAATASARYTAPEKLRGGGSDRRSDVFALGVMLWEVLAHERLFDGGDDGAIARAVHEAVFRPPSELNANVPAELDAICKRALARDPAERYPTAKIMAAEIDAVLGDAGYPESNDQIAKFVAGFGAPPAAAAAGKSAAPAGPRSPPSATQVIAAAPPPPRPAARPGTSPPVGSQPRDGTPPSGTSTDPSPSSAPSAAATPASPPAPTPPLDPAAPAPGAGEPSAAAPRGAAPRPARTEIPGSLSTAPENSPVNSPEKSPEKSPLAVTAFLGSNAIAAPPAPAAAPGGPPDDAAA
ncbi:MAG TPA: protein kinase, partial [Kofleriaceae bacterium]|nr:protein kinase [Kofleriaceae bacterium]